MKLTNGEYKAMKDLIKTTIDDAIEEKGLVTKDDISHLPSKDDFSSQMSEVMGELKTIRDQQTLITEQYTRVADHLGVSDKSS